MAKWDREEMKVGRRSGNLVLKSPFFVCVCSPVCVPMWDLVEGPSVSHLCVPMWDPVEGPSVYLSSLYFFEMGFLTEHGTCCFV